MAEYENREGMSLFVVRQARSFLGVVEAKNLKGSIVHLQNIRLMVSTEKRGRSCSVQHVRSEIVPNADGLVLAMRVYPTKES